MAVCRSLACLEPDIWGPSPHSILLIRSTLDSFLLVEPLSWSLPPSPCHFIHLIVTARLLAVGSSVESEVHAEEVELESVPPLYFVNSIIIEGNLVVL